MSNKSYKAYVSEELGRHIKSTKYIKKNEIIFQERPLCFLQSLTNSTSHGIITCNYCNAFIGNPNTSISCLSGNLSRQTLLQNLNNTTIDTNDDDDNNRIKLISCSNNCGVFYCSNECKQNDTIYHGHNMLCTGNIKDGEEDIHPLYEFKVHACQNNEIFLIIGHIITSIISQYAHYNIALNKKNNDNNSSKTATTTDDDDNNDNSILQNIIKPYLEFCWKPWWEIMDDEETSNSCLRLCEESSALLKDTLLYYSQNYISTTTTTTTPEAEDDNNNIIIQQAISDCLFLCTSEYFGRIIGSFELNSVGVRRSQPYLLWEYMTSNIDFQKRKCIDILSLLEQQRSAVDECCDTDDDTNDDDEHDDENKEIEEDDDNDNKNNYDIDNNDLFYRLQQYLLDLIPSKNDDDYDKKEEQELIDEILTPLDGTAMFSITRQMNHSCKPNAHVTYNNNKGREGSSSSSGWGGKYPLTLQCIALNDIQPNEELCISYIDQELSYDERVIELNNYHFSCTCVKCIQDKKVL